MLKLNGPELSREYMHAVWAISVWYHKIIPTQTTPNKVDIYFYSFSSPKWWNRLLTSPSHCLAKRHWLIQIIVHNCVGDEIIPIQEDVYLDNHHWLVFATAPSNISPIAPANESMTLMSVQPTSPSRSPSILPHHQIPGRLEMTYFGVLWTFVWWLLAEMKCCNLIGTREAKRSTITLQWLWWMHVPV